LVFGDSDWCNNRLIAEQGNFDLWQNSIAWLANRPGQLTIRPRLRAQTELALTPKDLGLIKFYALDLVPVCLLGLGAVVVSLRRGG
jgi:hypothetical protein